MNVIVVGYLDCIELEYSVEVLISRFRCHELF